jgi:VWFA-related protein
MRLIPSRPCATALAVLFLTTLAARAPAAEPPAEPQAAPPTFAAETRLVTVDVLVLDAQGKPVSDLKREDFRVREDGSPQPLTSFEAIEARLARLPAPQLAVPSESRLASNLPSPPTRRTFGIVFDDLHIDNPQVTRVRAALKTFLARETQPGDRLVLLTTAEGRFWTTAQGAGSGSFAEAIERLESHRRPSQLTPERRMSPVEAMRIMQGDTTVADRVRRRRAILTSWCQWAGGRCQCDQGQLQSPHPDGCDEPAGVESAEEAYTLADQGAERALSVLRNAIAMLGAQRDRKVLVLVSEGFLMDPRLDGFRQVRDAAARSNVVLYFLDARGLESGPFPFGAAGTSALPAEDVGPTLTDWRQEADGARTLAADTGGLSLQTNDLVAGLQRVADESRVTYLLGYEPPSRDRDGRYHTLKVEVLRRGLAVRARTGYFAPRGDPESPRADEDAVRRVLADPFDRGEIPMRLATYVQGPSAQEKGRVDVVVAGELRQDALQSRVEDGRMVAEPKLVLMIGTSGHPPQKAEWRITVADATPAPTNGEPPRDERWYPFATRVPLEPGDHRIRLVVESGDRTGSVTADVLVPGDQGARLSTPILSDRIVADSGGRRVMPLARRVFPRAATLHCWVELVGAENEKATGVPLVSASYVARSADGREWAAGPVGSRDAENADATRLVSIPLSQAPEGENELVLSVRDEISRRTYETREPFRVEDRGGTSSAK